MAKSTLSCGCEYTESDPGIFSMWKDGETYAGIPVNAYGPICIQHFKLFRAVELSHDDQEILEDMVETDELAMMDKQELNRIVSGALLDFLGFLAVGREDEEFNPKIWGDGFPTIHDLEQFAKERGLTMTAERTQNWNRIFQ
jgi:hypothetical protein